MTIGDTNWIRRASGVRKAAAGISAFDEEDVRAVAEAHGVSTDLVRHMIRQHGPRRCDVEAAIEELR